MANKPGTRPPAGKPVDKKKAAQKPAAEKVPSSLPPVEKARLDEAARLPGGQGRVDEMVSRSPYLGGMAGRKVSQGQDSNGAQDWRAGRMPILPETGGIVNPRPVGPPGTPPDPEPPAGPAVGDQNRLPTPSRFPTPSPIGPPGQVGPVPPSGPPPPEAWEPITKWLQTQPPALKKQWAAQMQGMKQGTGDKYNFLKKIMDMQASGGAGGVGTVPPVAGQQPIDPYTQVLGGNGTPQMGGPNPLPTIPGTTATPPTNMTGVNPYSFFSPF